MAEERVAIALGANLGPRRETLEGAVEAIQGLEATHVLAVSSWYETEAVGPGEQPAYLNGCLLARTGLSARQMLEELLRIEKRHGRDRSREARWGARRLDLDLLLYGTMEVHEPGLTVPHPRMLERRFVLEPLAEIAAEWRHPVTGLTIAEHFDQCVDGRGEGRSVDASDSLS